MIRKIFLTSILSIALHAGFSQSSDPFTPKFGKTDKDQMFGSSIMFPGLTITENISKAKDCTILFDAIKAAGLTTTFESRGPLTFFAPVNSAFSKLSAARLDSLLLPRNKYQLSNIIAYHAIAGRVTIKDIAKNIRENKGRGIYTTLAGAKLIATFDGNRHIVLTDETGGQCTISGSNYKQSNGLLHIVNGILMPKNKMI